jgi:histidinol-phosphate/aromatic aminotransferase/cobyric acid decarboxylase-like protein
MLLIGCQSMYDAAYYRTMEAFGQEKRDILVSEVGDARNSQEQAKEQFSSALEQFSTLIDFEGGELEKVYRQLETEFEQSEEKAAQVSQNINDVDRVAKALFREWQDELDAYTDENLRNASEQQLEATQAQYEQLIVVMRRAEDKMQPVLNAFRDQVLFLKHNLNARAIAALEGTVASLESEVATLIADMEASIEEANRFIDEMGAST